MELPQHPASVSLGSSAHHPPPGLLANQVSVEKGSDRRLAEMGGTDALAPHWRGVAKLIYAFRDYYEPELAYLEKFTFARKSLR